MDASSEINTVAISGQNGLVGKALTAALQEDGRSVVAITRQRGGSFQDAIHWDTTTGLTNPARLESVDAIVHLAGENIAGGRWNEQRKRLIRHSRVEGTRSLVQSIATIKKRPKVLVCASAIGFYGDRGSTTLDETSAPGQGFLADVCQAWEAEASAAAGLGMRVVNVRIGVVLSPKGGALAKMLLPFKMGVGGKVGSGQQYWSWIGLHDLARVLAFCISDSSVEGPVNAVSPEPQTNSEFTSVLGQVLHRPTIFPLPGFMAKLALGEMATELLLASTKVVPKKLQAHGFRFDYPDLKGCLTHELKT